MNIAQFTIVVAVSTLDIGLGIAVLQRNDRSRSNRWFAAAALCIAAWIVLSFMSDQPAFYAHTMLLNQLTLAAGVLVAATLTSFAVVFPGTQSKLPLRWAIGLYVPATIFVLATFTSSLLIRSVQIEPWGTNVVIGPLYVVEIAWILTGLVALAVRCARTYRAADQRLRVQYGYLYFGLA